MKIALAQINPVVGDVTGNCRMILEIARQAARAGAGLVAFPELSITGYPPRDLLDRPAFIQGVAVALDRLAGDVPEDLAVIVGAPVLQDGVLSNCAVVCLGGRIVHLARKQLLPYYDVFDETRYFSPGRSVSPWIYRGEKLGIMVCEDAWRMPGLPERPYQHDPVADLAHQGATLFLNLSASPFQQNKRAVRERIALWHARRHGVPFLLVNQVGGNDELVFDGCSIAAWPDGSVESCRSFGEDLVLVDTENREAGAIDGTEEKTVLRIRSDMDDLHDALVLGVRDYAKKCGFRQAVLGLSGGIDSALTAVIAVHALGAENVIGVTMPSRYSSQGSLDDSYALAKNLGIRIETIPIEGLVGAFGESLKDVFAGTSPGLAEENVQARIRGTLLMSLSNKFGWLLLTTGNKSELSTGYCTLYGDMNGGLSVLGDVLKTRVYELSRWINRERIVIPEETITKPPSAELRPDQKDSDSLPEYDLLDWVLSMYLEEQMDGAEIMACGLDGDLVKRILSLVERNEYKRRQAPPVLRVTGKAFGSGRRMPIAARVRYE